MSYPKLHPLYRGDTWVGMDWARLHTEHDARLTEQVLRGVDDRQTRWWATAHPDLDYPVPDPHENPADIDSPEFPEVDEPEEMA
jgi:hypothetical protein